MTTIDWTNATKKTKIFSFEGRKCIGKVVDVYDGDTVKIVFPLSEKEPDRLYRWNCRLINVDTPELRTKNLKEKEFGKLVRNKLREKILDKLMYISCMDFDKYGRLLVEIFEDSEYKMSINNWLISNEYAKEYHGGKKSLWFVDEE
jgi:endonuclease YncB( thermonuclease family)